MSAKNTLYKEVLELFEKNDEKRVLKLVQDRKLKPDECIPSNIPSETFALMPAAIERGWIKLLRCLVKQGVSVNQYSMSATPLMIASAFRNHEAIEVLLSAGADVNLKSKRIEDSHGETALMVAAEHQDLWTIRRLLEAGGDAQIITFRKHTAVYYAVRPKTSSETAKIVRELINAGCPLLGYELHAPVYRRDVNTTKLLLELQCPPNVLFLHGESNGPRKGETPLTTISGMSAVDFMETLGITEMRTVEHRVEIVQLLLAAGAEPNLANAKGMTPLMLAVKGQEFDLAELLYNSGADPTYVPPKAKVKSPLDLVESKRMDNFIKLFQSNHRVSRSKRCD